jgi:YVTN family beta-propeller protein
VISQTTTYDRHPRLSRPRWWRRHGARAAALCLSLVLTAAAATGLAAAPAWAAGGYHITYIGVGRGPQGVAVSPDGTRVYIANARSDSVSVIDTATNKVTATIGVGSDRTGWRSAPTAPAPTSPTSCQAACR